MNPAAASSDAVARAGNRPLLTWVTVVAAGELLGFVFPMTAGILWADTPWGVAAIMAAGAIEGAILGLAQWSVMRRDLARLSVGAWVAATASAAAFAYALGFLPSSYATTWTAWPVLVQIAVAIPLVAALLLSIGTAQWLVLRRLVGHAWWWIPRPRSPGSRARRVLPHRPSALAARDSRSPSRSSSASSPAPSWRSSWRW